MPRCVSGLAPQRNKPPSPAPFLCTTELYLELLVCFSALCVHDWATGSCQEHLAAFTKPLSNAGATIMMLNMDAAASEDTASAWEAFRALLVVSLSHQY